MAGDRMLAGLEQRNAHAAAAKHPSSIALGVYQTADVHFQLSLVEPETHDMPGVVSTAQHAAALRDYPDPRLMLGPLYEGDELFES